MTTFKKTLTFTALFITIFNHSLSASECSICLQNPSPNPYVLACTHASCITCLENLVTFSLKEKRALSLECPRCENPLTEQDLKIICPDHETQQRAIALLKLAHARKDPRFKPCPTSDCSGYFIDEFGVGRIINCGSCKHSYCSSCSKNHKQNISCEKFKQLSQMQEPQKEKQRSLDDQMTQKWTQANTKECPKCKTIIEKNGGCKKMTCYDCRYVFHWDS